MGYDLSIEPNIVRDLKQYYYFFPSFASGIAGWQSLGRLNLFNFRKKLPEHKIFRNSCRFVKIFAHSYRVHEDVDIEDVYTLQETVEINRNRSVLMAGTWSELAKEAGKTDMTEDALEKKVRLFRSLNTQNPKHSKILNTQKS